MNEERRAETQGEKKRPFSQPVAQVQPLPPATQISNCCKAPVWLEKGTDRPICDKCRGGCKPITLAAPEPPPAPPHDPCIDPGCPGYPGYDPGITPTCAEEDRLGPYSVFLRPREPAVLLQTDVPLTEMIRVEIPPIPETFDADSILRWFRGIHVKCPGGGLAYRIREKHWDVEQHS